MTKLAIVAFLVLVATCFAQTGNQCYEPALSPGYSCSDSTCRKDLFAGRWYNCNGNAAFPAETNVNLQQCAIKCSQLPGCTRFTTYSTTVCNLFVPGTADNECLQPWKFTGGNSYKNKACENLTPVSASGAPQIGQQAQGSVAFAPDAHPGSIHQVPGLNDGQFGNSHSWIQNTGSVPNIFGGIRLAGPATVTHIAFGRDNLGQYSDRTTGTYQLQYTRVANPGLTTPVTGNAATGWVNFGAPISRTGGAGSLRQEYQLSVPIQATGLRLSLSDNQLCIDEFEIMGSFTAAGQYCVDVSTKCGQLQTDCNTLAAGTVYTGNIPVNSNDESGVKIGSYTITLAPGDTLVVTASGSAYSGDGWRSPSGVGNPLSNTLCPTCSTYGLIAKVGSGAWFFVGAGPTTITGNGEVRFQMNDGHGAFGDNSGSWQAVATKKRPVLITDCNDAEGACQSVYQDCLNKVAHCPIV